MHALQAQRVETRTAERDLDAARAEARGAAVGLTGVLASAQGLVTLADQGLDVGRDNPGGRRGRSHCVSRRLQRGGRPTNAIIDQYNATLDILEQQITTLGNGNATQPA